MDEVVAWLLDPADPAVRAQALVDLAGRSRDDPDVLEARAAATERGSVARVLADLGVLTPDFDALYRPKYGAPWHRLVALAEMGAPGDHPAVAALLDACLDAAFGTTVDDFDPRDQETCITGNLARSALRLGRGDDPRVQRALTWLLDWELPEGGWHCWPLEDPHGTLDAWEALGAFAAVPPGARSRAMEGAMERGVTFILDQGLGVADPYEPWHRIHFPHHYYYDILLGLDLATSLGDPTDPRLEPALAWLEEKRGADGRWRLDAQHADIAPGAGYEFPPGKEPTPLVVEELGVPSRWASLTALRVLKRVGRA